MDGWSGGWMMQNFCWYSKCLANRCTDFFLQIAQMGLREYQIVGRHLPTEADPAPKIYRMRIFAPNEVVAKSRFWYFLRWVWRTPLNFKIHPLRIWIGNWRRSRKPVARSLASMLYVLLPKFPLQPSRGRRNGFADFRFFLSSPFHLATSLSAILYFGIAYLRSMKRSL